MAKNYKTISEIWQKEYSSRIYKYSKFEISEQFKKIAALFAPGESYFYIMNMHNLELDYISPNVTAFCGLEPEEVDMELLLKLALSNEFEILERKEMVIKDFLTRFLHPSEITNYKLVYTYEMCDYKGRKRVMLLQAPILSMAENNTPLHVLAIHSDISHITKTSTSKISFISLNGGTSYYNVSTSSGVFNQELSNNGAGPENLFTSREREIVDLLSKGLGAKQIATELCLSTHTVYTHRKNILSKSGCKNTAELIAESMLTGLIN